MKLTRFFVKQAFAEIERGYYPSLSHPLPAIRALFDEGATTGDVLGSLISNVIALVTYLAGIALLGLLVYGGFSYAIASGDEKAVTKAKSIMTNAAIGLVIVVAAVLITQIIGNVLGFEEGILTPVFRGPVTTPGPAD